MNRQTCVPSATDSEKFCGISARVFNFDEKIWPTVVERMTADNLRILKEKNRILGGLGFYSLQQWFGGSPLPTAGIALVAIPAEQRGTGVATELLSSVLQEQREAGFSLASLYASTQVPYRKMGFEQCGFLNEFRIPISHIGKTRSSLPMENVSSSASEILNQLHEKRAAATNGNISRTKGMWERLFDPREGSPVHVSLIHGPSEPLGYVVYQQEGGPNVDKGIFFMRDYVALSRDAFETLAHFISGHRSIYKSVYWRGSAVDALLLQTAESKAAEIFQQRWMTRILNVEQALLLRGYPSCASGEIHFQVDDPWLPQNTNPFVLRVSNGQADISEGGRADFRLNVNSLTPLFSNLYSATELFQMGRIESDASQIQAADQVFRLSDKAWMCDMF